LKVTSFTAPFQKEQMKKLKIHAPSFFDRISENIAVRDKLRLRIILLALMSIEERAGEIKDKEILEELERIGL